MLRNPMTGRRRLRVNISYDVYELLTTLGFTLQKFNDEVSKEIGDNIINYIGKHKEEILDPTRLKSLNIFQDLVAYFEKFYKTNISPKQYKIVSFYAYQNYIGPTQNYDAVLYRYLLVILLYFFSVIAYKKTGNRLFLSLIDNTSTFSNLLGSELVYICNLLSSVNTENQNMILSRIRI